MGPFLDVLDGPQTLVHLPGLLGEIANFHRLADGHSARGRLQPSGDNIQQGGLALPIAAQNAHPVVAKHRIGKVLDIGGAVNLVMDMLQLYDCTAQAAACQANLHLAPFQIRRLGLDLLIALDTGLLLGGPGLGATAQPFQLISEEILPLLLAGLLPLDTGLLLLQII